MTTIPRSGSIPELAVTFDMSDHQGQSALSRNKYDNKETVVEADDVMAAAAAAQQLVQMGGDSEDEVERHRPTTPPAVGSSTASSGRRRPRGVKDDDDDEEGGEERRRGVKIRRKRFRSIRIIYMKTKPMLEPSSAKRMRS